jgi:hypothetical protein
MEYVKRRLASTCFYGKTYKFQGVLTGFHEGNKAFYISQETNIEIRLPVKMLTEDSLFRLKRAPLNKVITLEMATGICKDRGLRIIDPNCKMKETVVMTPENTPFEVEEEKAEPIDPNRLTNDQVLEKLSQLGRLHDELRDGDYVIFRMIGRDLRARIRGAHPIGSYK